MQIQSVLLNESLGSHRQLDLCSFPLRTPGHLIGEISRVNVAPVRGGRIGCIAEHSQNSQIV